MVFREENRQTELPWNDSITPFSRGARSSWEGFEEPFVLGMSAWRSIDMGPTPGCDSVSVNALISGLLNIQTFLAIPFV